MADPLLSWPCGETLLRPAAVTLIKVHTVEVSREAEPQPTRKDMRGTRPKLSPWDWRMSRSELTCRRLRQ